MQKYRSMETIIRSSEGELRDEVMSNEGALLEWLATIYIYVVDGYYRDISEGRRMKRGFRFARFNRDRQILASNSFHSSLAMLLLIRVSIQLDNRWPW